MKHSSHFSGVLESGEILFDTDFGYIFNYLSCHHKHTLPTSNATIRGLMALGEAMCDPGTLTAEESQFNSTIPAIYTYLGQFIDHDITARTDRESEVSEIGGFDGNPGNVTPANPAEVVKILKNGRRPQLDLDSVFGDGPSFASEFDGESYNYETNADDLYNKTSLDLKLTTNGGHFDLKRRDNGSALIADGRNDENLIVSQLHASFIQAYNRIMKYLRDNHPGLEREYRHSRARQLLRWAYQYIVLNDYLINVCDPAIVEDTVFNGPYFYATDNKVFMPLEFSVAAFRFGHSMIRPFYTVNDTVGDKTIDQLLGETFHKNFFENNKLKPENTIDFNKFVGPSGQKARKIDWRLAEGLFHLENIESTIPVDTMLARLSQRNLIRGYSLSLPTGQAISKAMGIKPLSESDVLSDLKPSLLPVISGTGMGCTTPLWFYILKEADIHNKGERLGAVGSKLVAETLIGLAKEDKNSYLHNFHKDEVQEDGIEVEPGVKIATIADLLDYAGRL